MKITFLGTGPGVPEPHRRCSCTMVEVNNGYYFVDMGMMVFEEIRTRGISPDAVKGIFITHMHGDHADGLIHFISRICWTFKTVHPIICLPKIEAADVISQWLKVSGVPPRKLQYREHIVGVIYDDGALKVTAIPTQHCNKSYSLLLEAEGKAVLFTGDIKHPTIDFPRIAKERELDIIICEGAHFPPKDYLPTLSECKTKKICVNHYSDWNISNIQQLGKALEGLPLVLANDGFEMMV